MYEPKYTQLLNSAHVFEFFHMACLTVNKSIGKFTVCSESENCFS